ncbi:membrane protein insertion efficiency factor YidD [Patescibacteria group bacterium]|nr:membrane protein insertion efficiency factor YidD [Patescibacteria group bacterium]
MKKILLFSIGLYQKVLSVIIRNMLGISGNCRYSPTCSQYARIVIAQQGPLKGSLLTLVRVASCQPINLKQHGKKIVRYAQKIGLI